MPWILKLESKNNNDIEANNNDDLGNEKERKTRSMIKVFEWRQNVSAFLLF